MESVPHPFRKTSLTADERDAAGSITTVLSQPVPVRLLAERRRFHVTKVATCRRCHEGIAYLREAAIWLHRSRLQLEGRGVPVSYDHPARP